MATTGRPEVHFNIRHGALFDAAAREYDHHRPAYPDEAISDIVWLSKIGPASRLLEIGCGTGKATVQFASRGFAIDCIDPGRNLVAFARKKCRKWKKKISFTVDTFENVELPPHSYDLVFSAHAFHWVRPKVRLKKANAMLSNNGSLALFYNYPGRPRGALHEKLALVITQESRGKLTLWNYEEEVKRWAEEIRSCRLFKHLKVRTYKWVQKYTAEEYVGLFRTYSDFLSLPVTLQRRVADAIHRTISENGGYISRPFDCVLIHARANGLTPS
jgi:SAM-dependent methyltransferase